MTRVVLLESVAPDRVVQVEGEIRIEVKQRPAEKTVQFEAVAGGETLPVIYAQSPQPHAPTVGRIDVTEAVQLACADQVERNLPGGEEVIPPQVQLETERLISAQVAGVIPRQIVALVPERAEEWSVCPRPLIGQKRIHFLDVRTVTQEGPITPE
jgi:hypothetical protein